MRIVGGFSVYGGLKGSSRGSMRVAEGLREVRWTL